MNTHLAFVKTAIRRQLESGAKRCEVRLSQQPHPARKTRVGDVLLFKESGGEVFLTATISEVRVYTRLTPDALTALLVEFGLWESFTPYWKRKLDCSNAVFLFLADVRPALLDAASTPRGVMLGWVQNFESDDPTQLALFDV